MYPELGGLLQNNPWSGSEKVVIPLKIVAVIEPSEKVVGPLKKAVISLKKKIVCNEHMDA
jgi:hypothetical protein